MADDIVTRLQMFSLDDGTDALNKLLAEAADEIDHLRKELRMAEKWRDNYKLAFEKSQGKDLNDG